MNIPDIFSGKIVIGPEPHVDQSVETLDGDKPYVGTLSAVGPVFLGEHSDIAFGHINIGTDIGIDLCMVLEIDIDGHHLADMDVQM